MAHPTHFQSPCIHCGLAMEQFDVGPCKGDVSNAIPISYASFGVRWDGVEGYRVRYSDNSVHDLHRHVSERAPYYHFGKSADLIQPPRYERKLLTVNPSK